MPPEHVRNAHLALLPHPPFVIAVNDDAPASSLAYLRGVDAGYRHGVLNGRAEAHAGLFLGLRLHAAIIAVASCSTLSPKDHSERVRIAVGAMVLAAILGLLVAAAGLAVCCALICLCAGLRAL